MQHCQTLVRRDAKLNPQEKKPTTFGFFFEPVCPMKQDNARTWNSVEDMTLFELIKMHGKKWEQFTTHFPGRTASAIRNRHQRVMFAQRQTHRQKCSKCGLPRRGHTCMSDVVAADDVFVKETPVTVCVSDVFSANVQSVFDDDVQHVAESSLFDWVLCDRTSSDDNVSVA